MVGIRVITGSDTAERVTATIKLAGPSHRQYCFQVEAKRDGQWYWSVCVCHDAAVSVSGVCWSKVEAVHAAEAYLDELIALPDRGSTRAACQAPAHPPQPVSASLPN